MAMPFQAAQMAYEQYVLQPATSVDYSSEGNLLILADAAQLESIVFELPNTLSSCVLVTDRCSAALAQSLVERRINFLDQISGITIDGYLGEFHVFAIHREVEIAVNKELGLQDRGFDLILNLIRDSTMMPTIPPVGCLVPEPGLSNTIAAVAQLPDWVGEFEKPKYFDMNREICAHAALSIQGCSNCISACATGAIISEDNHIKIDPHLCQGCGDCTTVCPSGAVRFAYPCPEDTLNRLRQMLSVYASAGGKVPVILFHDGTQGRQWLAENAGLLPINIVCYEVESLGSVGLEIWLAALAYGAAGVLLLAAGDMTQESSDAIKNQIDIANEIINGMEKLRSTLRIVRTLDDIVSNTQIRSRGAPKVPAKFTGLNDKRTVVRLAVDFLGESYRPIKPDKNLPVGAPFGEIVVNTDRCTLCMSCVSVCPERALADAPDEPKLGFIESNCVQCGICETACPENAISLNPRYLYDSVSARKQRMLYQETPFCCIECGKPFATQKMIKVISEKLAAHPMFQGDDNRRLMMCEGCRVKNQFIQPGAGSARLKP